MLSMRDVHEIQQIVEIDDELTRNMVIEMIGAIAAWGESDGTSTALLERNFREAISRAIHRHRLRIQGGEDSVQSGRFTNLPFENGDPIPPDQVRIDRDGNMSYSPESIEWELVSEFDLLEDLMSHDIHSLSYDYEGRVVAHDGQGRGLFRSTSRPNDRTVFNRLIMHALAGRLLARSGVINPLINALSACRQPGSVGHMHTRSVIISANVDRLRRNIEEGNLSRSVSRRTRTPRTRQYNHDTIVEFQCTSCATTFESSIANMVDDDGRVLVVCSDECYDDLNRKITDE